MDSGLLRAPPADRNGPENAELGFRNRRGSGLTRRIALRLEGKERTERLGDQEQRCQAHVGFYEPRQVVVSHRHRRACCGQRHRDCVRIGRHARLNPHTPRRPTGLPGQTDHPRGQARRLEGSRQTYGHPGQRPTARPLLECNCKGLWRDHVRIR